MFQKESVLIVEDDADMMEYISETLQNNGYEVLLAKDGQEGFQLATKLVPNLVLSDLMMPVMDGLELTVKIKEDERTSHIPIILLTAKNELQSKLEGLKTGADDYLTKPFSSDELLIRIKNLIDQRKKLQRIFREKSNIQLEPLQPLSLDERFLNRAKELVECNLSDYTFTVEKMADGMHLSRTQLLRKLKALTGLSPNDFIKNIRLARAAEMIRNRMDTITQIGYSVGFNDQSYFTKCFKKEFGCTPTEYAVQSQQHLT